MPQIDKKPDTDKKIEVPKIEIKDESAAFALGSDLYKRFTQWRDNKRSIEEQWLKNLRAYHSVYEASIKAKIDPNGSTQYIGITRMKTTAAYARLVDVFFPASGHKFWAIKPTPDPALNTEDWTKQELFDEETGEALPDEEVLGATTNRMATRIDDQLVESDANTLIRAAIKDACTFGSGVIKAGMVKIDTKKNWVMNPYGWEIQKEENVVPGMEQPSPFDIYFDTNAASPESSLGVYHRHILNKEEVRNLADFAGFKEDVIDALIADYPNGNHNREHHEIERQSLGNITTNNQTGNYEVLEYWGYVDALDLRNAGIRIRDEQMNQGFQANVWISAHKVIRIQIDNTINKGKKFFVFPYEQISNQLWGVGVPEIMMDSQDVLNAAFRRLLDDMALSGNQLEINVERLDDRSVNNANKIIPWKIWYRSGGDDAFNAIKVHNVPSHSADFIQIIEMVRRFIDDETNLPSLVSGQAPTVGTEGAETASGLSMLMGAAQIVIKSVVKNIDDFLIKPLIRSYYNFNMEWSDDDNIKGDMKVQALGSSILIAREVQNRNMIEFLGLTNNELDAPLIERPNILRDIAKNMGFDEDRAIKSDRKIKIEAETPDPMQQRLSDLAIEKAELENAELQGKIDVLESEKNKNIAEAKYKEEFLRQRRIKLAEDIKLARVQTAIAEKETGKLPNGNKDKSQRGNVNVEKPVKILNEA